MPSVNMIAARRAEKHRLEQNTRKLVYGVVGELGLILVIFSFMLAHLITTETHTGMLEAQIKNLQPKVNEIQKLESETTALQPEVQVLDMARAGTLYWYSALQSLASSLPPKTWVTSVATNGAPSIASPAAPPAQPTQPASAGAPGAASGATLTVAGMSSSQKEVGEAMLRMNGYANFEQAILSSVQKSDVGKTPAVSFQMVVELKAARARPSQGTNVPGGSNAQKS